TAAEDVVGESMKRAVERMRPYLYGTPQETELTGGPVVYTSLSDSSVVFHVKYTCRATKRRQVKSDISDRILELFNMPENKGRVVIAYPHTELVFRDQSVSGVFRKYLEKNI
ncbi:MAG: hypothetical protein V1744_06040, partial [Candidatus Altiarchaeota archaeon]